MPSIYQTINQRAEAIKADRWQHYTPLTRFQLTDYDAQADEDNGDITLIALTADGFPPVRSTRRSATRYKQFRVIKRPTEALAVKRALTCPDESPVIRVEPEKTRWCILCKDRHPVDSFITFPQADRNRQSISEYNRNKRYLHGLSYACRDKLLAGWHGRRWRIAC